VRRPITQNDGFGMGLEIGHDERKYRQLNERQGCDE
jgi:hypothetical protein